MLIKFALFLRIWPAFSKTCKNKRVKKYEQIRLDGFSFNEAFNTLSCSSFSSFVNRKNHPSKFCSGRP